MAKKVAIMAVNPVNGMGLFQYLEAFFENGIQYKTFAVSDSKEIKTNSGITLILDDVIANLKGKENEFDAVIFGCGDAIPKFKENTDKQYNQDMMAVLKAFTDNGKIIIGHCAAAMLMESLGVIDNKKVAV
ncbi:MAG: DJ-1/PfpI family protein, partial [Dysgonomonas sp.]